jgi:hypothetical protein
MEDPMTNIPELDDMINDPVTLEGKLPDHNVNIDDLKPYLDTLAERAKLKNEVERTQRIVLPDGPCAIAPFGDQHFGGKVDYPKLFEDTQIVAETKNFFAGHMGDLVDNFIIGKLQSVQKLQPTTFQQELRAATYWLQTIGPSLLFWLHGNHQNWTTKVSGADVWRERLSMYDCKCLYDPHQIYFELEHCGKVYRVLARHKWKYSSIFNPTHGIEVGWERGGINFDIGIGAHTHIATLCREFIKEGNKHLALLLGTYKLRDEYARECGFPDHPIESRGSGAIIFLPDGRYHWVADIKTAAELLQFYQNRF